MKIVIIEDENLLAKELINSLNRIAPHLQVIKVISGIQEGVAYFRSQPEVDLIFSDIQLTDGTSFELFQQIQISAPIIFTTAYDEYAISAFKVNSIDYLLKPMEDSEILNAINKYDSLQKEKQELKQKLLRSILNQEVTSAYKSTFVVKRGDQFMRIKTVDIGFFYAEGNTVFLVSKNKKRLIVDHSLEEITQMVDPNQFFRINRQMVVNNDCITRIHRYFNSRLKLDVEPTIDLDVLVTRSRVPQFLKWINH